ncbi:ABC transporter ATP-binding protein [Colwellia asteriadis]|uniref:ABC transporter ATP-binding protein n=1 Tax=Colwellia asteriadis TaxID=517723 RepID=A0ABN1L4R6_9GAMM
MSSLLSIKQLSVVLQNSTILSKLDLSLAQGEILGLVGASGCGKTTLLNTIAGFLKPSQGVIDIDGNVIVDESRYLAAEKRHIGVIFQDYALFPHLTVKANVAFGISHLPKTEQNQRIEQLLAILKLSELSESHIHQLSGGQQQRVAIARALAPQPKLLLLDEPFSNIDARLRNELMLEIRQLLKQVNTTAIFVTHNKDEVFTFADKMAVMAEGKLLQFDSPATICQQPNSYQVADFLQLGSWLPCQLSNNEVKTLLGVLPYNNEQSLLGEGEHKYSLLVKPSQLNLQSDSVKVNAQVEYVSVTEQGYHYHFSSLVDGDLSFTKLSLYSEEVLELKQQVELSINSHKPLVYGIG